MLTNLSFERFKSWKRIAEMRLAPITALFGTNSSGKTSVLQLLLMLKQTAESSDRAQTLNLGDDRALVNLGTVRDLVYRHELPASIKWALAWTLPKKMEVADPEQKRAVLFADSALRFEAQVAGNGSGPIRVSRFAYHFADHDFVIRRKSPAEEKYQLFAQPEDFHFKRTRGRAWDLPAPVKCYGFPDQVRAYYQNAGFLSDLELAFEELFARTYYLGPLREYPKREYTWAGAQPADMGRRGELAIAALLASRDRGEKISRGKGVKRLTLEEYVAWWLRELGLIHRFRVEPISKDGNLYQVRVQQAPGAPEVLITDVGFGVSQILPVLALCYYVPEGSIILMEQPEIHLHPSVQAGLADVLIDAARIRGVQIIIESHSEHLLRRLQRRVAEEKIQSDEVALYFCNMDEGTSQLTHLELDLFGRIANWPKDFFGDEFGEIAAMTEAAMGRKQQAQR